MLGVPCRIHDMSGDDLGVAHLPPPVQIGDLIALQHKELRVYDVVLTGQDYPVFALVRRMSRSPWIFGDGGPGVIVTSQRR